MKKNKGISLILIWIFLISGCAALFSPSDLKELLSSSGSASSGSSSGSSTPTNYTTIYVASWGSDTNGGLTRTAPLFSLQKAIDLAKASNYIASAIRICGDLMMTNTNGNDWYYGWGAIFDGMTNVTVSGGWNYAFSARNGNSVLNGNKVANLILYITNCSGIELSYLTVTGSITNDFAADYSLGIALSGSVNCSIGCTVSNIIEGQGGAIHAEYCSNTTISGTVVSNTTMGIYIYYCTGTTIEGTIACNYSPTFGGGVCLQWCSNTAISGLVSENRSGGGYGGGISLDSCFNTMISGTITSNTASIYGGGVDLSYCVNTLFDTCLIQYNSAPSDAGIHDSYSTGTVFSNCIITPNN